MQTNDPSPNLQVRSYFLEQGKSIARLYDTLNANVFVHHLRKWVSLLIEIALYIFFICLLTAITIIPADPGFYINISDTSALGIHYKQDDLQGALILLKLFLTLSTLPILLFAILLGRNRRKNNLIHQAFNEVKKMKENFDKGVRDLRL